MSVSAREAERLARYNAKRDFRKTPEPSGQTGRQGTDLSFVIQKHWASRLHYDFRLELDGVLLSWAVPKGPSFDPRQKRMAVHVEDHPVSYGKFEGRIPAKQYGAGTVILWDEGTWEPIGDPREGMRAGKLVFELHGQKLAGLWELVRISRPGNKQDHWILFKKRDRWARPADEYDVISALPDSVTDKPLGLLEKRGGVVRLETPAVGAHSALSRISGAVKAVLPNSLSPQLAKLSKTAPLGPEWSVEAKFDGYRLLARIEHGRVRLLTRNGHDWTAKLPSLATAVQDLDVDSAWLDGEIVVLKEDGAQDFNALQNAIDRSKNEDIVYYLFDVPYLDGYDLRAVALAERRAVLEALFDAKGNGRVRFSESFPSDPLKVLQAACRLKLEGVIVKRLDAPYVSARTETWIKLKCSQRQEFVIGGYTDRAGSTTEIGGLLLGVHDDDGKLRHAGSLGTGWSLDTARKLKARLLKLHVDRSPFETGSSRQGRWSKRVPGGEHWVKPLLVAEVSFAEWTPEGHIRHASFQGLRSDKPAKAIIREVSVEPHDSASLQQPNARRTGGTMKISNADRIIDSSTGATKLDLVRYYESVADLILPHLKGRPVSLVRGPSGIGGELFFQKHPDSRMTGMTELDPALWPGHAALMEVGSQDALVSATQMNVIEFHTWNARYGNIDKPDRMIFDLDPGEGTTWVQIQEAALLTRALLNELALVSFLKTSGGKGLHVVVPLTPRADWETVKGFSQAIVQHMAKTIPDRFVAKSGPANRVGKLFVDYLRNGHGATTAAAFSARARPGLGVSMPLAWDDLQALKSGAQWTIATAREYLSFQKNDPWMEYWKTRQTLTAGMKRLGYARKI